MADEHHEYDLTDLAVSLHALRSPDAVLAAFAEAVPSVAERDGIEIVDGVLMFAPGALADDEVEVWTRLAAILATALENAAAHDAQTRAEAMLRSLIEQLPAVSYIAQPISGNPIYISPQLEQLFGSKVSDWMQGFDGWVV